MLVFGAFLAALFGGCGEEEATDGEPAYAPLVTKSDCGGCDIACWLVEDEPAGPADVVIADPTTCVGYSAGDGGVVLDGTGCSDADGDGLPDIMDPTVGDANGDWDGDGYPDAWEANLGMDPLVADAAPPSDEWYVVLPYGGPEITRQIPPDINLRVESADVYFLIDTTGSMSGEINNLKSSITSTIIPQIDAALDDAQFGVGHYREIILASGGHFPYRNVQNITNNVADVVSAVNSLSNQSSALDWPESGTAALHAVATGNGLPCGDGPSSCGPGYVGYPCFRPGALPVIIVITDASFSNGVWDDFDPPASSCYDYSIASCYDTLPCWPVAIPQLTTVATELNAIGAKVLGVWSYVWPGDTGHISTWTWGRSWPDLDEVVDLYYIAEQTGAVDGAGVPFVYGIDTDGSGLGMEIVNAVNDMVDTMLLAVNADWVDPDPPPPDSSVLINDVEPVACSNCGSLNSATNTAIDVVPGSTVTFDVRLENALGDIPATPAPQTLTVHIRVWGNGTTILDERIIHVLIPGTDPTVGVYHRDYDALLLCAAGEQPLWNQLFYDVTAPAGTEIEFFARAATPPVDITAQPRVSLGVAPADGSPLDVQEALGAAAATERQLRIEAELRATTPGDTPVLHDTILEFYCIAP